MSENISHPTINTGINQINIKEKGADINNAHRNIGIVPFANNIIIKGSRNEGTSFQTSLQDFLFAKFCDVEINKNPIRYREASSDNVLKPSYYPVDTNAQSVWQAWNDYQEILKRRLVGAYNEQGYLGDYFSKSANKEKVVNFIIERYDLKDDSDIDGQEITAKSQAEALLMNFNQSSFWERVLDEQKKQKDKIWGLYKNKQLVGYFDKTEHNIAQLQDVYKEGFLIEVAEEDGETIKTTGNSITTDEEAVNLLLDCSKKSLAQHILDLQDFWKTVSKESYGSGLTAGVNIANTYDIKQMKNSWTNLFSKKPSVGLEYKLFEGAEGYYVVGLGTCNDTDIVIPDKYEGMPVIGISQNAFSGANITNIKIPEAHKFIIGPYAFYNSRLKSIRIPDNVTYIGAYAFCECKQLAELALGNGITAIPTLAFGSCSSLKNIVIPDTVTNIENSAFHYCEAVETITIGKKVRDISARALSTGGALTNIIVAKDNSTYIAINGSLYTRSGALVQYALGKLDTTLSLWEDTWQLRSYSLERANNLKYITINEKITSVGELAMQSCKNLLSVVIDCPSLKTGSIFGNCPKLKDIYIGPNTSTIYANVFRGCNNPINIYIAQDEKSSVLTGAPWGAAHATIHWNTPLPIEQD